jgi:hypothetical protein
VKTRSTGPPDRRHRRLQRLLRTAAIAAGVLVLLVAASSFLLDEPLRRTMERKVNQRLHGYTVRLHELDFQPVALAVVLRGLEIRQDSHPEPAVAIIPTLRASVQWKALFSGRLVADFVFHGPRLHVNLIQLRSEVRSDTALKDKGWQEAALAIFPLRINLLEVENGEITYIDEDPARPLRLTHWNFRANDIRNARPRAGEYPSPIQTEAAVFETGRAKLEGRANFLVQPSPGLLARFRVENVPLDRLRPVVSRANLLLQGGSLSAGGDFEFAPTARRVHLADVTVRGLRLDYVRTGEKSVPREPSGGIRKTSQRANDSRQSVRVDALNLLDCNFGLVNRGVDPPYRIFLDQADLRLSDFGTEAGARPGLARLTGRFMGSGKANATLRQRASRGSGQTFDLDVAVEDTDMTKMNQLLRAHGNFDVVKGTFSLFSEIRVDDGVVRGYVKPLFQDMEVYDRRQEKGKSIFKKVYESIVDVVAELLENRQRDEVATVARLSGRVANPNSSTLEILAGLLENAFFKAILPGFEQSALKAPRPKKKAA